MKGGNTAYELVTGDAYQGKLCPYGSPVMAFVGDTNAQKGDSKWLPSIFSGKTVQNDMYIVSCGGAVRLTRSVKMLFPDWNNQIEECRQVKAFPSEFENGMDDEAAVEPEDEELERTEEEATFAPFTPLVPIVSGGTADRQSPQRELQPLGGDTSRRNAPPPPTAAVAASATPRVESTVPDVSMEHGRPEGVEQAGQLTRPARTEVESIEPEPKRARAEQISVMKIGEEEMCHMDFAYEDVKDGEYDFTEWFNDEVADSTIKDKWEFSSAIPNTKDSIPWISIAFGNP